MAKHLRVLDEHGEVHEQCPGCESKQYALDQLAKKHHGALAEIGRLKADRNAEATAHEAWPTLTALFALWRQETGHLKAAWTGERFWEALPRLQEWGPKNFCAAIAGETYDPNRKRRKNGSWEVFDSWELLCRNSDTFRRFILRRPRGWVLPEQFGDQNEGSPPIT